MKVVVSSMFYGWDIQKMIWEGQSQKIWGASTVTIEWTSFLAIDASFVWNFAIKSVRQFTLVIIKGMMTHRYNRCVLTFTWLMMMSECGNVSNALLVFNARWLWVAIIWNATYVTICSTRFVVVWRDRHPSILSKASTLVRIVWNVECVQTSWKIRNTSFTRRTFFVLNVLKVLRIMPTVRFVWNRWEGNGCNVIKRIVRSGFIWCVMFISRIKSQRKD